MSKEEIIEEIEKWETKRFMNLMNDHWGKEDYEFDQECQTKLNELREKLKEVSGDE